MKKRTTLEIGTISHGTLKMDDLLEAMLDVLGGLRLTREDRSIVRALDARFVEASENDPEYFDDDGPEDLYSLTDIAGNYAPPYCYVGMHEGDGSDLGVWPLDLDDVDEDIYRSSRTPGEDKLETRQARERKQDWLHVNDHGNASLYTLGGNRYRYTWGIV